MTSNDQEVFRNIKISLTCNGTQVFFGKLKDLHTFMGQNDDADRARIYGENDMVVASMNYQYLKSLVENRFTV